MVCRNIIRQHLILLTGLEISYSKTSPWVFLFSHNLKTEQIIRGSENLYFTCDFLQTPKAAECILTALWVKSTCPSHWVVWRFFPRTNNRYSAHTSCQRTVRMCWLKMRSQGAWKSEKWHRSHSSAIEVFRQPGARSKNEGNHSCGFCIKGNIFSVLFWNNPKVFRLDRDVV